jgi:TrmH family RNA methyltransferase
MTDSKPKNIVVLVEPELAENIGFCVRAMACFGLTELVLVGTPRPSPDSAAFRTATLGKEILAQAREASSLHEAFGAARTSIAFTRRPHHKGLIALPHLARASAQHEAPWALVFGRESIGLTSEEVLACDLACNIPTSHPTGSFNLGQAVAIALAMLHECPPMPVDEEGQGSALAARREEWSQRVAREIEARGVLHPARLEAGRRHLHELLRRLRPSDGELRFLEGLTRRFLENGRPAD